MLKKENIFEDVEGKISSTKYKVDLSFHALTFQAMITYCQDQSKVVTEMSLHRIFHAKYCVQKCFC